MKVAYSVHPSTQTADINKSSARLFPFPSSVRTVLIKSRASGKEGNVIHLDATFSCHIKGVVSLFRARLPPFPGDKKGAHSRIAFLCPELMAPPPKLELLLLQ